MACEAVRESIAIELRVGPRARHGANVDDEPDLRRAQQVHELGNRARRVTNREEWVRHGSEAKVERLRTVCSGIRRRYWDGRQLGQRAYSWIGWSATLDPA